MFSLNFDRISLKISDKIWNMTFNLIKNVLENAGVDEGDWIVRAPHRVRNKKHERFRALRIENRVGADGVRIRCKPQGNDTCFEYTIVPPSDLIDINDLFMLLQRVHPKTLEIHDTLAMKAALHNPDSRGLEMPLTKALIGSICKKINSTPEKENKKPVENIQELTVPVNSEPTPNLPRFTPPRPKPLDWLRQNRQQKQDSAEMESLPVQVAAEQFSVSAERVEAENNAIEKMSSLVLTEPTLLADQEVLDRALIAMAFVSTDGYCSRVDASNSIIKNLDILNFIRNVSQGTYNAVESAMRSLMMGLRKNNYIERVYCGEKSDAVRGYKFTIKGEKRIVALQKFLDGSVISKMNRSWGKFIKEEKSGEIIEPQPTETPEVELEVKEIAKTSEIEIENYEKLESLAAALREANDQIVEAEGFIRNLDSEKQDLDSELFGIDKIIEEQIRCKTEIEKRIAKFEEKQKEIKNQIEQKNKEIVDWQKFQLPCVSEKERLKKEIESLAGTMGIALRES